MPNTPADDAAMICSTPLSQADARDLALSAQCFGSGARPTSPGMASTLSRLGVLQIDSVNALIRSHYLPLYSRLGAFSRKTLDQMAWGEQPKRGLFEYWGHEASLLPFALYSLFHWRMQRAREGIGIYRQLAVFGREQQAVIRHVLQAVVERGPLSAGELSTRDAPKGPWWDWSLEKHAMEWLFAAGELTVAGRRGFERLYDLPERVIPDAMCRVFPSEDEAQRGLLLHAAKALGVATEKDLRDYFRLDVSDTRQRLKELTEDGQLIPVSVDGWSKPAWMPAEQLSPSRSLRPTALLSPFDSLIWERERTERLFGFRYRLEFYVPPARRIYGYYVMPFLYRGQLVGRVDLRAERPAGRLTVHALHEEAGGMSSGAMTALAQQLRALASWLELESIQVRCQRREGMRLAHEFILD